MPVELWDQVLVSLPKVAQKECMFVCRSWRRVCRRALFAVVRLSAGSHNDHDHMDMNDMEKAARAWEILDCMGSDGTFAAVVKTIIVLKWKFGGSVFETRTSLFPIAQIMFNKKFSVDVVLFLSTRLLAKGLASGSTSALLPMAVTGYYAPRAVRDAEGQRVELI